ncbi:MAG: oligosaccharide flippase family protein [candidate division WOR-3 bacterium]
MVYSSRSIGKKLIIGSSYYYTSLLINKALTTVSSIFLARTLGPTNFGMIAIVNYLLLLLLFFAGFGIPTAIVKLIPTYWAEDKKEASSFIGSAFFINFLIIVLITLLYYLLAHDIAWGVYRNEKLGILFQISAFTLFFLSLSQYGNSVIQALGEFKLLSFLLIFNSLIGLILLIPLTKLFGIRGTVLSQSFTALVVFFLLLNIFQTLRKKHNLFPLWNGFNKLRKHFSKLSFFAFPLFLSGLVMVPALTILTTILSRVCGFQEVGFFNIGYSLMQIILFLPTAVGVPFIPLASRLVGEDREKLKDFLGKTISGVNVIVLALSFLIGFFAREIIKLFYGSKYEPAQNILLLLLTAGFLCSFGYIVGYYLLAIGKVWLGTLFNFIWFVVILVLAFPLIKWWGLVGLGLAYLLSYTILAAIFCFYLKGHLKESIQQVAIQLFVGTGFLYGLFLMRILIPSIPGKTLHLFKISLPWGLFLLFSLSLIFLIPRTLNRETITKLLKRRDAEE